MSGYSPEINHYIEQGEQDMAQLIQQRQKMRTQHFDTIATHGVYSLQEALKRNHGSIIEPIFLSSAQHFENSAHLEAALAYLTPSWAYSRIANPTMSYLEETLALLETYATDIEASAHVTSSGMAAIFLATQAFLQNSTNQTINIVASAKCYGGTFMLFNERYGKERGIDIRWVSEIHDLQAWQEQIDENTRFVYAEMPSNPSLDVVDIAALAEIAHAAELPLIVDSTVATPALLRPLALGADIVVHSLSKTITASGMAIAGAMIAKHHIVSKVGGTELTENYALYCKLLPGRDHGAALSPFSALMILNELRTLRQRVEHLSDSTQTVTNFLMGHKQVEHVYYPGNSNHAGHELAKQQMHLVDCESDKKHYGHLLSFTVAGGEQAVRKVFDNFTMIFRGTDLGRIKSIATIPAISTHQQQGEQGRALAQLPGNLIRLSIGNEHPGDLVGDIEQALRSI